METIILILSVFIVVLILLYFLKNRKSSTQNTKETPSKSTCDTIKNKAEEIVKHSTFSTDNPLNAVPAEIHSDAIKINYFILPENIFPATIEDIEDEEKAKIESTIASLPQIPTTSAKLLSLLRNPESNLNKIASLVSTNPLFSGKILQTVNSSFFKLPEKITSVGRAITLLGYNNVRAITFHETINGTLPKRTDMETDLYMKIWVHSAVVSACSGYIGKTYFKLSEYDLATIGLLHDIGSYFLTSLKNSIEIVSDIPFLIKEEHQYGINHAVAGCLVAAKWKLPDEIKHTIEYHHYPSFFPPKAIPKQYLMQTFIVCLANLTAKILGYYGQDEQILPIKDEYFELYGIEKDIRKLITNDLLKNIEKSNFTVKSYIDAV